MATATTDQARLDNEPTHPLVHSHDASRALPLVGRILYSSLFLMAAPGHFTDKTIGYAASQGVPMANVLVPLSGILALLGGLSVLLGYRAKLGAWLLVVFLVPVTAMMHAFWTVTDPQAAQIQMIMFMKNLGLLGGTLFLAYFGAGPLSLDARIARTSVRETLAESSS
jgi:putative oxidoreductase